MLHALAAVGLEVALAVGYGSAGAQSPVTRTKSTTGSDLVDPISAGGAVSKKAVSADFTAK